MFRIMANHQKISQRIVEGNLIGKHSWIIVMAEGAGSAVDVASHITQMSGLETRAVVLGHVQRGGRPTAVSREMALRLGRAAVECLLKGEQDKAVAIKCDEIYTVDLAHAIKKKELKVAQWHDLIKVLS